MIKVQLRRIKTGEEHVPTRLDNEFVKGVIPRMPKVGEGIIFYYTRMDEGWWRTTPIREIVKRGQQMDLLTLNSIYTLVKGWGDPRK